jgi:site-specific DNA-methyltransferase (adenine-specific)
MKPYYSEDGITIYHGDCREILPEVWFGVGVTVTDPPYNVGLNYCDGDRRKDYAAWTQEWFVKCPQPLVVTPGVVNLAMWLAMAPPRWTCVWVKPNQCSASALNGFNTWEPVLVYGKHKKPVGQDAWVMSIGTNQVKAGDHPCPKWYPFWSQLVERFSLPQDLVLDPFAGSGTTLEAAKNLGRAAIGIEIEESYCEIAAKRLSQGVLNLEQPA